MKTKFFLSMILVLGGCAIEHKDEPAPAPCTMNQPPPPVTEADAAGPKTVNLEFEVYPLDTESDDWSLQAGSFWQTAASDGVKFHHHALTEKGECVPQTTLVKHIDLAEWETVSKTIEADPNTFSARIPRKGGCTEIWAVWPWPVEVLYPSHPDIPTEYPPVIVLNEYPPVVAIAHAFGHVIGLEHATPEERSIMVADFKNLQGSRPTCLDVNRLSVLVGRPLVCKE